MLRPAPPAPGPVDEEHDPAVALEALDSHPKTRDEQGGARG